MTVEEQLKAEILRHYKSIRAFSQDADIPYSTIDSILKRGLMNAGVGTVIKIFSIFHLDVESIASGSLSLKKCTAEPVETLFTDSAFLTMVSNYQELNLKGREKLVDYSNDLVLSGRYSRFSSENGGKTEILPEREKQESFG